MGKCLKMSMFLIAFAIMLSSSIHAVNEEAVDLASQWLKKANASFLNKNLPKALAEVNLSTDYNNTPEAMLFKILIENDMGDISASNDSLKAFKVLYPKNINGNILSALLLSLEYQDGNEILKNIDTALKGADSNERESILAMVEQSDAFNYFRVLCEQQYKSLEPAIEKLDSEPLSACKENITKVENVKKQLKYKIWVKNDDVGKLKDAAWVANVLLKPVPPPYKQAIQIAIKVSLERIKRANKGCGVVLHYLYVSGPAGFWPTPQK
jgi:hypothetical protein